MKREHRGFLYRTSLTLLLFGTVVSLGASAYDTIYQAATDGRRYYTLLVISGAYFLLGLSITCMSGARWLTMRRARRQIPKSVIPIREDNLPKYMHGLVHREFSQIDQLRKEIRPLAKDRVREGWGRPDSDLAGINFRAAACETFDLLAEEVSLRLPILRRTPGMTAYQFFDQLTARGIIDRRTARVYVSFYESARFDDEPWTETKYLNFMKLVSIILQRIRSQIPPM